VQLVALVPSQVAAQVPLPGHADRVPRGPPDVSVVQVPRDAGRLHASHWPVQALSQQTPSWQKPLAHSSGALPLHATPIISLSRQTPAEQYCPLGQRWVLSQLPLHWSVPQTYGVQG
jgi:hypothetical protein